MHTFQVNCPHSKWSQTKTSTARATYRTLRTIRDSCVYSRISHTYVERIRRGEIVIRVIYNFYTEKVSYSAQNMITSVTQSYRSWTLPSSTCARCKQVLSCTLVYGACAPNVMYVELQRYNLQISRAMFRATFFGIPQARGFNFTNDATVPESQQSAKNWGGWATS